MLRESIPHLCKVLLAIALLLTTSARAADEPEINLKELLKRPQVQVFIENDTFSGTDQYYTNGFKVGGGAELPVLGDLIKPISEAIIKAVFANPVVKPPRRAPSQATVLVSSRLPIPDPARETNPGTSAGNTLRRRGTFGSSS